MDTATRASAGPSRLIEKIRNFRSTPIPLRMILDQADEIAELNEITMTGVD
ncbi:hypothetical protein [Streptomyces sp. NPDC046631]|uniref:hypothetical protein n=1 Tax=unclassified Streptomyces TaxID=2593676 RepID=UPI00340AACA9